jgi:hypothetical protein
MGLLGKILIVVAIVLAICAIIYALARYNGMPYSGRVDDNGSLIIYKNNESGGRKCVSDDGVNCREYRSVYGVDDYIMPVSAAYIYSSGLYTPKVISPPSVNVSNPTTAANVVVSGMSTVSPM